MTRSALLVLGVLTALLPACRKGAAPLPADPFEDGSAYLSTYRPYAPAGPMTDTPAPAGYKAVYLSHYARHGSRYLLTDRADYFRPVTQLENWDLQGLLTPRAKDLLADLQRIRAEHERMDGMLTRKGYDQHRDIGKRMARRFSGIFRRGGRVQMVSSPAQRCIASGAACALALSSEAPGLDFSLLTGPKYYDIISTRIQDVPQRSRMRFLKDSLLRASLPALPAWEQWFTAVPAAYDPAVFWPEVHELCAASAGMDEAYGDLNAKYFTRSQLRALWEAGNVFAYGLFCDTVRFGPFRQELVAKPILEHIIARADSALAGSGCVADLRFGHDSGLLPLSVRMGLEGSDRPLPVCGAAQAGWYDFEKSCMAANLQLVFYARRGADPLVKILFNEQEIKVPALEAVNQVYYRWPEIRSFWLNK